MGLNYHDIDREIDRDLGVKPPPRYTLRKLWAKVLPWISWTKYVGRAMLFPIFPPLSFAVYGAPGAKPTLFRRLAEGIMTRMIFSPFIFGVFLVALVWYTTHPAPVLARQTPGSLGLYYRQAPVISSDGQVLQAWYIPGLTTDEVLRNGDDALRDRRPAAILVHGLGMTHDQYLTLASQLHETGFAVLMLSLRGQGESAPAAVTFGLRERFDVLAAINYLRDVPQIDPTRICLVGSGIGASAILQAALLDHSISAVVADAPLSSFTNWSERRFEHPWVPTGLLNGLYGTAFELTYRERVEQLDLETTLRHLEHTSLLLLTHNQADEAPVQSLLAAAAASPAPHQVLVLDPTPDGTPTAAQNASVTTFLASATKWTPAEKRLSENLRKLMDARVK